MKELRIEHDYIDRQAQNGARELAGDAKREWRLLRRFLAAAASIAAAAWWIVDNVASHMLHIGFAKELLLLGVLMALIVAPTLAGRLLARWRARRAEMYL
jgi:membrane protein YdbS with pleckstrin-like domain